MRLLTRIRAFLAAAVGGTALVFAVAGCASSASSIQLLGPPNGLVGRVSGTVSSPAGPVDNAIVSLAPGDVTTATDATGAYAFDSVSPGGYLLSARATGFADSSREVTVIAGRSSGGDIAMPRAAASGSIFGHVTDGLLGVGGALVRLGGDGSSALTADDGTFLFSSVAAGLYTVNVSRPGFFAVDTVARVGTNSETQLDITLARRSDGSIVGRVTDGLRGLASCNRPAVVAIFVGNSNAQQTVPRPADCAAAHGVSTVDDHFRFDNLATGSYILQAAVNGFTTGTKVVRVLGGAENDGDIVLSQGGTRGAIAGTVFTDTLLFVRGATVNLSIGQTSATTKSGADGRYLFSNLSPGTAVLAVSASGLQPGALTVSVTGGNTADGTVVLRR